MNFESEKINWVSENIEDSEEEKGRVEKAIKGVVEHAMENGEMLGEGRTASVYKLEDDPTLCLKLLHTKNISPNRTIKEEYFLDIMFKDGVPVPRPFCAIQLEDKGDYLLMETIEGFSLKDLVEKNLIDQLPEDFDFKKFFDNLRKGVELMHNKKIHHRDLHHGNIMIDKLGNPVIIDFGDAVVSHLSSEDPYREINTKGELKIYPRDEDNISRTYKEVGEYLKGSGFFSKK